MKKIYALSNDFVSFDDVIITRECELAMLFLLIKCEQKFKKYHFL